MAHLLRHALRELRVSPRAITL
eukprot:COSAG01_NODE_38564_length_488_cov_0.784062_2_plen_21_part_01